MKRLSFLLLVLVAMACSAQPADVDIVYSGMVPRIVMWDAPVEDINGDPFLDTDIISYNVYYAASPFVAAEAIYLAAVTLPEAVVDFSALARGYYYVGVSAVGQTAEGAVSESDIAWSNDPVAVGPTSRFAYLVTGPLLLARPVALRDSGM